MNQTCVYNFKAFSRLRRIHTMHVVWIFRCCWLLLAWLCLLLTDQNIKLSHSLSLCNSPDITQCGWPGPTEAPANQQNCSWVCCVKKCGPAFCLWFSDRDLKWCKRVLNAWFVLGWPYGVNGTLKKKKKKKKNLHFVPVISGAWQNTVARSFCPRERSLPTS